MENASNDKSLPWLAPDPFIISRRVETSAIDGLNHVNNACFVNWCEAAAWEHSRLLGVGLDEFQAQDRAMAVRHASYDYRQAAYLDDTLLIATWLRPVSGLKMERRFQVLRQSDQVTVVTAIWQLVCIEISSGKARRMPTKFVQAYSANKKGVEISA